ncbi:hypothetical protein GQ43DRAFT_470792 [Delitschia confertaspora ATCC 74209]|uniref:Uncharacterized protein n=1 Tax=Delitschia confertaspora ATCC 74209 TaxID=1513339 RepID=A0A9P4JNZ2_9PLEO|nr:hypothetical protein GQ43DRAFT_470792 [Delitschia confertaspora ATCC 74209]
MVLLSPSALSPISPIFRTGSFPPKNLSLDTPPQLSGQPSSVSFSPISTSAESSPSESSPSESSPSESSPSDSSPSTCPSQTSSDPSPKYAPGLSTFNPLRCPAAHSTGPFRHCQSPKRPKVPLLTLRIPNSILSPTNRAYTALHKEHQHEALRLMSNASPYPRAGPVG